MEYHRCQATGSIRGDYNRAQTRTATFFQHSPGGLSFTEEPSHPATACLLYGVFYLHTIREVSVLSPYVFLYFGLSVQVEGVGRYEPYPLLLPPGSLLLLLEEDSCESVCGRDTGGCKFTYRPSPPLWSPWSVTHPNPRSAAPLPGAGSALSAAIVRGDLPAAFPAAETGYPAPAGKWWSPERGAGGAEGPAVGCWRSRGRRCG